MAEEKKIRKELKIVEKLSFNSYPKSSLGVI
jgi:hypothetical protein